MFKDIQMDRDEAPPEQHGSFLDHCIIAAAAILIVACSLGMAWSFYLFPLATLFISGFVGCGLIAVNIIQMARRPS